MVIDRKNIGNLVTTLKAEGKKITLENYLTQQDIAQVICTSRQTAVQLITDFETEKQIVYTRKQIVIENIETLK